MATLSVMGLYQFNNTIFDEMVLPTGVDKELLVNNILIECAELETLYPNDEMFKLVVNNWSQKEMPTWEKLFELFNMEYNPLYNVDAYETITEERDLTYTHDNIDTHNLTNGVNMTETNSTSGFNSDAFQNHDKTTNVGSNTDTGTLKEDGTDTDKGTITTTNRRYGNIGVTMTQQMIEREMDVRAQMNIINYIIKSFKNRFCLLIY